MNELKKREQLKKDCIDFFKQSQIWNRLFIGFRNKYESYGRFSGKVTIRDLSANDIEELEGFFQENYHGKRSVTISAEKFEKALLKSKFQNISPQEVLSSFFGEQIISKAQVRTLREQKILAIESEFIKAFTGTPAADMLEDLGSIAKASLQINKDDDNTDEFKNYQSILWLCASIYNTLPYRDNNKIYLAVFAAKTTGNPHSFDKGTTQGNILYQVIQKDLEKRCIIVEASDIFPAYKRLKSYLLAGIMIDDISNYALLYNIHAIKKDGSLHEGIEGFAKENNIVQVPLNVISEWDRIDCVDNEIYIVENPSVFAMICGEKSCMCMNGQPKLAGLIVLELLAKSGTHIFYSGDLDPEGVLIAQKLSKFYQSKVHQETLCPHHKMCDCEFSYWHMTKEDYMECMSNESLSEKRMKMLDNITDTRLVPVANAIVKYQRAGYQENINYENELQIRR